jgi:hypothetical protein
MIFGIEGDEIDLTVQQAQMVKDKDIGDYRMMSAVQVTEQEMFRIFKKNKNIADSKYKLEYGDDDCDDIEEVNTATFNNPIKNSSILSQVTNLGVSSIGVRQKGRKRKKYNLTATKQYSKFPYGGAYIIPKMFGYFPFLDCDDVNTYTEAKFQLSADNVPHSCYKSNKHNHYWIFCDKQCEINEAIDFIESYPCDHRYPWVARYKQELVVRAIPKADYCPRHTENHLKEEFSDDFAYWNSQFVKYWSGGLIPSYIDMVNTLDSI